MRAVNLFIAISTQWRVGMGGATGLDNNVLFAKMERMRLSDSEWVTIEDEIRILEDEALTVMRESRK